MEVPSYRLQKLLYVYVSPVIVVVGLLGNVISMLVLSARPMRRVSTYCYLAVLSAVDSLVLGVGLLPKWLDEVTYINVLSSFYYTAQHHRHMDGETYIL